MAQPNPVSADPGDAGSHGGEVQEEGARRRGRQLREVHQAPPGKFKVSKFREFQWRHWQRFLFQEESVAAAEGLVLLADEGDVDSAQEAQLWQQRQVSSLLGSLFICVMGVESFGTAQAGPRCAQVKTDTHGRGTRYIRIGLWL